MTTYVPGTLETDPKKQNMSLQQIGPKLDTAITNVATNTTGIATNTANIATNTSDIASNTTNIATNTTNIASNSSAITALQALVPIAFVKNSLSADVTLNSTTTFFDGPSISQGTSGTWFVSGQVTCIDTAGAASFVCQLWDGTTLINSAAGTGAVANTRTVIALSGVIASPAANIRISVKDTTSTSGKIIFNASALSKDSSLFGIRIA